MTPHIRSKAMFVVVGRQGESGRLRFGIAKSLPALISGQDLFRYMCDTAQTVMDESV